MPAVRVRTSTGWQDMAVQGPSGPPGGEYELASVIGTADVAQTATAAASANTVLTLPSINFDGITTVTLEFWCRAVNVPQVVGGSVYVGFWMDGVQLGTNAAALINPTTAQLFAPMKVEVRITPNAGAHVFSVRTWGTHATGQLFGGQNPGSAMFARVKRVAVTPMPVEAAMVKIAEVAPASPATSLDFPSIPQTYRHLMLMGSAWSGSAATATMLLRINNDGGAAYDWNGHTQVFNGAVSIHSNSGYDTWRIGVIPGTNAASEASSFRVEIPTYSASTRHWYYYQAGGYINGGMYNEVGGGRYYGAANPITRLTLYQVGGFTFSVGTRVSLYGLQ